MYRSVRTVLLFLTLTITLGITVIPYPNYIPQLVKDLDHPNFYVRENSTELLIMHRWSEIKNFLPECGSAEKVVRLKRIERALRPDFYTNSMFRVDDDPIKIQWKKYWW